MESWNGAWGDGDPEIVTRKGKIPILDTGWLAVTIETDRYLVGVIPKAPVIFRTVVVLRDICQQLYPSLRAITRQAGDLLISLGW